MQSELEEALRSLEQSVAGSAPVDTERERTYMVPIPTNLFFLSVFNTLLKEREKMTLSLKKRNTRDIGFDDLQTEVCRINGKRQVYVCDLEGFLICYLF